MNGASEGVIDVRVYYEDTDAGGIVYHSNYLKYAERGRTEYLRDLGFDQSRLRDETGLGFAVTRIIVDYLTPARLDDRLLVRTVADKVRRVSLDFTQTVERGDATVARLTVRVACIDAEGRPARMPAALIAAAERRGAP